MTILDEIVAYKKIRMSARSAVCLKHGCVGLAQEQPPALDFATALRGERYPPYH